MKNSEISFNLTFTQVIGIITYKLSHKILPVSHETVVGIHRDLLPSCPASSAKHRNPQGSQTLCVQKSYNLGYITALL